MFLNGSGELVSACGNGKKLASLRVEETLELPVVKPLGVIRHGSG
jgi:predicted helicase